MRHLPSTGTDSTTGGADGSGDPEATDAERAAATDDAPPLLDRLSFGGVLAFSGINQFRDVEQMIGYADAKGVPAAEYAVPFTGGMLLFGGLGVALWRLPRLAAGVAATFLAAVTPVMYDFWNVPAEQKQSERNSSLMNTAMLGAALAFLSRASRR